MKKLIIGGLFLLIISVHFCSCVTEKKVNEWLKEHPTQAAGYCADNFPPDTTTRVITDSVDLKAYEAAYWEMSQYADSLFNKLEDQRNAFKPTPERPCPPSVNLDSLRKAVDIEIRKRLTPCKDSIQKVTYTIVDKAREKQLQGKLEEKDGVVSARDKRITEQEAQVNRLKKWPWLFWGLVALAGLYVFAKLKFKLPF